MSSSVVRPEVVDVAQRDRAAARARELGVVMPTFTQLAQAAGIPSSLSGVGPDQPDPKNLWRINWYNDRDRKARTDVPGYFVLPPELTGVKAPIVVMLGRRFPMIGAHKVLPAYSALAEIGRAHV